MAAAQVEVGRALPQDRLPIARMLELYQHDLSDLWPQDLDVHGEDGYPLDRYWVRKDCHPFVATVNGRYAGFALVDASVRVGASGHWIDQFFVLIGECTGGRFVEHQLEDASWIGSVQCFGIGPG